MRLVMILVLLKITDLLNLKCKLKIENPETTNNQMEMQAVIEGLSALKKPSEVTIYTDSKYVKQGAEEWLAGWKAKNWLTASKKPVKNKELWEQIDSLIQCHQVTFIWVKGHAGHEMNERVDKLAVAAVPR